MSIDLICLEDIKAIMQCLPKNREFKYEILPNLWVDETVHTTIQVDGLRENDHLGGARIGIVAKPSAEFVAGMLGTWFGGGVAVPLALSYPEAELLHVMNDSSHVLQTLFPTTSCDPAPSESFIENLNAMMIVFSFLVQYLCRTLIGAQFSLIPPVPCIPSSTTENDKMDTGEIGVGKSLEGFDNSINIQGEDPALIIYTSGTTGKPKGAVHTHQGILAQVEFIPKFSVIGIWQRWRESYPEDGTKAEDAISVFTGVPTIYTRLIQGYEAMDPELKEASASAASKLRLMMCGSSALPYPVMQQWETITGRSSFRTIWPRYLQMGLEMIQQGWVKLCIKSPSLFKEYWKLPEVTKESFVDGGFFKTGDAVKLDEDGYYIILGHKDYGEAVSAIVVPNAELKRRREEELKPAVSLEELCTWAKERLAPYKLPTRLFLWETLPLNAMGKVNKNELKKILAAEG
ncbi:AMP-dependent synthetase and ligase family protein [Actinidia rufa]|uniref:AMP-dependent synthetase and ligase family protein n=1 Tax=Actinidia rufa TaxID=165716 RepID=A0A7J0FFT5_9ERIC|nr:AMP-dependent synthetase and ligase family protein [Actinidia rufa]